MRLPQSAGVVITFLMLVAQAAASAIAGAPLIVAHRGASHEAPENTLAAVRLAWEQGADAVEADFHLTADGKVACIHDGDTERVTSKRSNLVVADSPMDELAQLDVGSWKDDAYSDERVPTLSQVLDLTPPGRLLFIEIKSGPKIVPSVADAIREVNLESDQVRIISFKKEVIRAAKEALPAVEAYWLVDFKKRKLAGWCPTSKEVIQTAVEVGADGVDVQAIRQVVDADFLAACRDAGLSVHVWTVNEVEVAEHFAHLGVDSITTNKPLEMGKRLRVQPQTAIPLTTTAEPADP